MAKELVGHIGVDSGGIILCDPCYLSPDTLKMSIDEWYDQVYCGHEYPTHEYGDGLVMITGSGWGDGYYPVYAEIEGGRCMSIEVRFNE